MTQFFIFETFKLMTVVLCAALVIYGDKGTKTLGYQFW
jgi:hypothetical protein